MIKKFFILLIPFVFLLSCKKNDSPVGVDVLPGTDQLGAAYAEIYPSVSYPLFDDSLFTKNITNSNLLGSVNDPVFGRTDASIYVNFEVPGGGVDFGPNAVLDSVVLSLIYNPGVAFLGDTTQPLSIDVFPLTAKISKDSSYYSTRNISYNKNYSMIEGGQSKSFYPRLNRKILVNKDDAAASPPQLNIKLRKEFGEMLFNPAYISSLSTFQNIFYGFFISTNRSVLPQPSYGSIFYVNMNTTALRLYYHNSAQDAQLKPLSIYCASNSVRFGHFDHDYKFLAEPKLAQQLYSPFDTVNLGKQNIYVQGISGLKAKVAFPDLLKWQDSNIVINKAELVFSPDKSNSNYYNSTLFPYPGRLYLEGYDPTTGKPTYLIENAYAFGGFYDGNKNHFTFSIPHTVGGVINKKGISPTFFVSVYTSSLYPQRIVLGGYGNTSYPIKIKLWYTRLTFGKTGKVIPTPPQKNMPQILKATGING